MGVNKEGDFSLKTLFSVISEYLEKRKDYTERWLLNRFKEFMHKNYSHIKVKDVKHEHFEKFLNTLSVSEKSLPSYASRLNRFKAHIGLSKKKVKDEPKPMDKEYRQLEKKLAEKEEALALHRKTIEEKDQIINTLMSKGMEIEKLGHLDKEIEAKKAQLAEIGKVIERQKIVKLVCPQNGLVVSFGNDCCDCPKYLECSAVGRLLYPS